MLNIILFKEKVKEILNEENISFEGKNLDKIINSISETQFEKIIVWLNEIKKDTAKVLKRNLNLKYKSWKLSDLLTFRYPFIINDIEYRILVIKIKNGDFIEFHLGNHKYYDKKTGELFLKKSTKYLILESENIDKY